jgi:hypothetical protein
VLLARSTDGGAASTVDQRSNLTEVEISMGQRITARQTVMLATAMLAAALVVAGVVVASDTSHGLALHPASMTRGPEGQPSPSQPDLTTPPTASPTAPSDDVPFACPAASRSSESTPFTVDFAVAALRAPESVNVTYTLDIVVGNDGKVTVENLKADKDWARKDVEWTAKGDGVVPSCLIAFFDSRTVYEVTDYKVKCDGCSYGVRILKLPTVDTSDRDKIPFKRFPFTISPFDKPQTYQLTISVKLYKNQ